jgi:hypothetical protein
MRGIAFAYFYAFIHYRDIYVYICKNRIHMHTYICEHTQIYTSICMNTCIYCFLLFLRLYPASAGIKDSHLMSPYDLAVSQNLSTYFIRLLLCADPAIDPVRRHDLNFASRRQGMFLAFKALSSNIEPTIWARIRYEDRNLLEHVISYL